MTLKQFRKHVQYVNVLGLADMELTFSTAAHKCYSWQNPALLVSAKQFLEVTSELFLICTTPPLIFYFIFLFLGLGLGLGWGLYLLSLLSCNNLTGLLAFLPPSPMLQEKEASKQLGEHLALSYGWPIMVNEQVIFEKEFITGRQTNSFPSSLVFSYLNRKVKIVLVLTHTSTSSQLASQGCS